MGSSGSSIAGFLLNGLYGGGSFDLSTSFFVGGFSAAVSESESDSDSDSEGREKLTNLGLRFLGAGDSEVQNGLVRGKIGLGVLGIPAAENGDEHGGDGLEEWSLKRGKVRGLHLERKKHRVMVVFRAIGIWQDCRRDGEEEDC